MNSLLDDDDDFDDPSHGNREFTLGTGTILAIFLVIAALCGLFFGFGYKMGSNKKPPLAAVNSTDLPPATPTDFNNFKPAAGSPVGTTQPVTVSSPSRTNVAQQVEPPTGKTSSTVPSTSHVAPESSEQSGESVDSQAGPGGAITVQVAAFTHQEDADLLVHALKLKGYPAFERNEPQDKLLHIQVGPFTNRKDAEAARQKLLADGYQPIVK